MSLLRAQTERALRQLNEARAEHQETALEEVPDESYDAAFHRLFDHPEVETLPTDDELRLIRELIDPNGLRYAEVPNP